MAVFGYIIYIIICMWVSLFTVAVFSWPGSNRFEQWIALIIFGLFWYGAWLWAPFKMVSA